MGLCQVWLFCKVHSMPCRNCQIIMIIGRLVQIKQVSLSYRIRLQNLVVIEPVSVAETPHLSDFKPIFVVVRKIKWNRRLLTVWGLFVHPIMTLRSHRRIWCSIETRSISNMAAEVWSLGDRKGQRCVRWAIVRAYLAKEAMRCTQLIDIVKPRSVLISSSDNSKYQSASHDHQMSGLDLHRVLSRRCQQQRPGINLIRYAIGEIFPRKNAVRVQLYMVINIMYFNSSSMGNEWNYYEVCFKCHQTNIREKYGLVLLSICFNLVA